MLSVWFSEWLRKRREERGRQLERQEWVAWLDRLKQAQADGRPFDEPPPSERQSSPAASGNNA